jgi:hypothetical protein
MSHKVNVNGVERDATPEEVAEIESRIAEVPVPNSVTMRQARLALLGAGLLGQVSTAIASLASPHREQAEIEWEFSSEVYRNRPLVAMLGPQLGLTDEQLDQLFITAAGL